MWIHKETGNPGSTEGLPGPQDHVWALSHFYGLGHVTEPPEGRECEVQSWDVKQSAQGP